MTLSSSLTTWSSFVHGFWVRAPGGPLRLIRPVARPRLTRTTTTAGQWQPRRLPVSRIGLSSDDGNEAAEDYNFKHSYGCDGDGPYHHHNNNGGIYGGGAAGDIGGEVAGSLSGSSASECDEPVKQAKPNTGDGISRRRSTLARRDRARRPISRAPWTATVDPPTRRPTPTSGRRTTPMRSRQPRRNSGERAKPKPWPPHLGQLQQSKLPASKNTPAAADALTAMDTCTVAWTLCIRSTKRYSRDERYREEGTMTSKGTRVATLTASSPHGLTIRGRGTRRG